MPQAIGKDEIRGSISFPLFLYGWDRILFQIGYVASYMLSIGTVLFRHGYNTLAGSSPAYTDLITYINNRGNNMNANQLIKDTGVERAGEVMRSEFEKTLKQHRDALTDELEKLGKHSQSQLVKWDIEQNESDYEFYFNAGWNAQQSKVDEQAAEIKRLECMLGDRVKLK